MQKTFLYELNEKPPLLKNLIYGLQWAIVAIPNAVVFTTFCATALGLDPAGQIAFAQRLLIAMGLMTILQSLKGHRLPILESSSSAVLLTFMVLAPYGLSAIEGGLICGGLLLIAVGKFKWFKRLSAFFTPNVIGVILMLVALSLLPYAYPRLIGVSQARPYGDLGVCGFSLLTIFFVSLLSHWSRGFFQTTSMLAGIFFGLILFVLRGEISFALVRESSWLALPSPLLGVWPTFSLPAVFAMVCTYLAVMLNTVGSIQGMSGIVGKEDLENRTHRGIAMTGLGGTVAAFFGVTGLVSVAISTGVVLVSRVASRYALTVGGAVMITSAFLPKLWALLTIIPPSVIASALFVAMSSQLMAGMSVIMSGKTKIERREYFTVGMPLLSGAMVSILPKQFLAMLPTVIAPLISNGLVVGILFSLFLEHVLFRPQKEVKG
jgi:xanthine/uracil permease